MSENFCMAALFFSIIKFILKVFACPIYLRRNASSALLPPLVAQSAAHRVLLKSRTAYTVTEINAKQ